MGNDFKKIIILFLVLLTSGCASTLPEIAKINNNYSMDNIKTFSVNMDCSKTVLSDIQQNFAESYCQVLEGNIKLSLQKENPTWRFDKDNPDMMINATLEQVHGGSAAARFWIGFGAGRSVTTAYVKILKNNAIVAERRFTETTTMPNIASNNWSNEDAITQDAPLIAKKIAEFVHNPVGYESR